MTRRLFHKIQNRRNSNENYGLIDKMETEKKVDTDTGRFYEMIKITSIQNLTQ